MLSWSDKKQEEILDYSLDWKYRITPDDQIQNSQWSITSGNLTVLTTSNNNDKTTIWVSGGTPGQTAIFKNTIITNNGRSFIEYAKLKIVS